jgi:hypothetical protein
VRATDFYNNITSWEKTATLNCWVHHISIQFRNAICKFSNLVDFEATLSGSPVTMAWRVLRLRMEAACARQGCSATEWVSVSRTADRGWLSSLGAWRGADPPHRKTSNLLGKKEIGGGGGVRSGFVWLRTGTGDGLSWMWWWTFQFWCHRVSSLTLKSVYRMQKSLQTNLSHYMWWQSILPLFRQVLSQPTENKPINIRFVRPRKAGLCVFYKISLLVRWIIFRNILRAWWEKNTKTDLKNNGRMWIGFI